MSLACEKRANEVSRYSILTLRIFAPWRLCVRLPLHARWLTQSRKAAKKNRKVRHCFFQKVLDRIAIAEKCSVVHETSLFNHIKTDWVRPGKDPKGSVENSWLNVLWRGDLLDVVLVTFTRCCYSSRHHLDHRQRKKVGGTVL